MLPQTSLSTLMAYTDWADRTLYAAVASAPEAVVRAPRSGRPGGMLGTLSHIYVVDLIWKGHLTGTPHGQPSRNLDTPLPLQELSERQAGIDRWYLAMTQALAPSALADPVSFTFVDGGEATLLRSEILLHVVNHKTYHRGYVADMLYESGMRPPTIDLTVFLRDHRPQDQGL